MEILISVREQAGGAVQRVRCPIDGELVLGRGVESPVALSGTGISREHVRVTVEGESVVVVDLSSNGTWIDGRRLTRNEKNMLRTGETVQVPGYDLTFDLVQQSQLAAAAGAGAQPGPPAARGVGAFLKPVRGFVASFTALEKFLVFVSLCGFSLVVAYLMV